MTDAKRDNNSIPVDLAVLQADGVTPSPIRVDPSTHYLKVVDGTTGTDQGTLPARRDANSVTTLMAVSNDGNATLVPLYLDSSFNLLVKST